MIRIDTREPSVAIADTLVEKVGFTEFAVETLYHGADFVLDVNDSETGIQRKRVNDFVGSIGDLKETLFDTRTRYDHSVLLLEGEWQTAGGSIGLRRGKKIVTVMDLNQWHNFLVSQQLRGTLYVRTASRAETCRVLVSLHGYLADSQSAPVSAADDPRDVLLLLPGIGPERAEAVLDEYGHVHRALANLYRWEEIDGIGAQTRQTVIDWLEETDQ